MTKYHQVVENPETGWSDWEYPIQSGYKMCCCDCDLVHDIEFQVIRVTKVNKDGTFQYDEVPTGQRKGQYRAILKARRNNRATSAKRRKKK